MKLGNFSLSDLLGSSEGAFGLDIGLSGIKVCQVAPSRSAPKIEKFAMVPLSEAALIEDEIQKPEEVIEAIKQAVATAGIKSKNVVIGVYGPNTMTKRLQVPGGSHEEVEDHVLWESDQYITFGADESQIDYHILGEYEAGGMDVLMAAARTDTIEPFMDVIKRAGFVPRVVDLQVLALSNVFEAIYQDRLAEVGKGSLLIDFGAQSTKLIVYRRGGPIFTKEINMGGVLITEEIQRQMGLSYDEAEDLKVTGDSSGHLPEEILQITEQVLENIFSEIKKTINFFTSTTNQEKISYCFLTGGSSNIPGLVAGLQGIVNTHVELLDPFQRFTIDRKRYPDEVMQTIRTVGCMVLGLALRGDS